MLRKSPPPKVTYDPNATARIEEKFAEATQARATGQPAAVALDSTELDSYLSDNLELPSSPQTTPMDPAQQQIAPTGTNTASSGLGVDVAPPEEPSLEEVQSSVRDVRVDMDGDLVKAYVVFNLHGKDLSLELDGHLSTENGYMKFDPVGGKLGSLPLPQSALNAAVERLMNSPENRDKLRLPDDISDVQVANGQAVVTYK